MSPYSTSRWAVCRGFRPITDRGRRDAEGERRFDLVSGHDDVVVANPKAGKQNVKIVWRVRGKDGGEIGTVGQENDVPAGLLDGAWGDVAYMVAVSAQDGIMQLVARGAPPAPQPPGKS